MSSNKGRIKSGARPNILAGQASEPPEPDGGHILFSFRHLDLNQGQSFDHWEESGLLALAMNTFRNYSTQKMTSAFSERFKCYPAMPEHCEFTHPRHVPADAKWTSMHIQGKECVIGHIVKNIFYVVFLDAHHKFYPTNLQDRGK